MRSYKTNSFLAKSPCVVALGCFDGVHIGHKAVIDEAVRIARSKSANSVVWTFREPPKNFFFPNSSPIITEYEEKHKLIQSLGVDVFVSVPFDLKIGGLYPIEFFEKILLEKLKAVHIVCGYNYAFGKNGNGNTELLKKLCSEHNIGFTEIPIVTIDGVAVSSSQIRREIQAGNVEIAAKYLDRPFALCTTVIDGHKLARQLGFPTINQAFSEGRLVPKNGVYLTGVSFDSKKYFGITNVGTRPTVDGKQLFAETHIFDFSGDLYGKRVQIEFLHFMREETTFKSVDELADRVRLDIHNASQLVKQFCGI